MRQDALVAVGEQMMPNHCISFFRGEILAFFNLVRTSSSRHVETISLLPDLQSRHCGVSVSDDFMQHAGGVRAQSMETKKKPEMAIPCVPQIRREIAF